MKKKLFTILLSVFMMIGTFTTNVFAADTFNVNEVKYEIKTENTVEVMGGTASLGSEVIIPSTVTSSDKTYTVTSIADYAFQGKGGIQTVSIPGSVTSIGNLAFENCNNLSSVTFGEGLLSIGENAFQLCKKLTTIAIPSSVTSIGKSAFVGCIGINTITCNAVNPPSLGNGAFDQCTALTKIQVPANSVHAYKTSWSAYEDIIESIPLTIADVLKMSENTFPETKAKGWVKAESTNENRAYIDETNLVVAGSSVPLDTIVTKDGNTYKCTIGNINLTFNMEPNVLESITFLVSMAPPSKIGDYVPYKYEVEQTSSISKGSTNDLVFETNGIYADGAEADVEVKLNGQLLTLNTQYKVEHGSIKVTLLGSYIKDLTPGTYTISIGVLDSFDPITSQFTITASTPTPDPTPSSDPTPRYKVPNTGVEGTITINHSFLKLSSLSLLAIGTYIVIKK